ncbi:MAG TPA: NHL repeat-containing protein, partial [Puia sp.]|nr:NHL repeat-containing protein [Puia sp.]
MDNQNRVSVAFSIGNPAQYYLNTPDLTPGDNNFLLPQPAVKVLQDMYGHISVQLDDGTVQQVSGNPVTYNVNANPGLLGGFAQIFLPEPAYADGPTTAMANLQPTFAMLPHIDFTYTNDGRVYVLGMDGTTIYAYDILGNLLSQISASQGLNDPFKGIGIGFSQTGGVGGSLTLADQLGHVRTLWIPYPPNFAPFATPTITATFTLTATGTTTSTPTSTPSNTACMVNGTPCTGSPTPTITETPTISPTPTISFTPFATPIPLTCPLLKSGSDSNAQGVALDALGKVYAADPSTGTVDVLDSNLGSVTQMGSGVLSQPSGVAVDNGGNIYVTDQGLNEVFVFNSQGTTIAQWGGAGTTVGQFETPTGIAVNSTTGQVFVVDQGNMRLQVFTTQGAPVTNWGQGLFGMPEGVALDSQGNVYVTDSDTMMVYAFTAQGAPVTQWFAPNGGGLSTAQAIAVGPNGLVYVGDNFGAMEIFDTSGNPIGSFYTNASDVEGLAVNEDHWYVGAGYSDV